MERALETWVDQPPPVTRADIEHAAERIAGHVRRTPVMRLEAGAFDVEGELILKLELLQRTGSFKLRGAFNRLLSAQVPPAGVVAASGGNFGLAVACAARETGHPAEIFVPETSPAVKVERIRDQGFPTHIIPGYFAEALEACRERAMVTGAVLMHAYDQPEVVAGQGTIGMELSHQAPDVTTVLVAVGGGGLVAGIASWFAGDVRIIGVEPRRCPTLTEALRSGGPVDIGSAVSRRTRSARGAPATSRMQPLGASWRRSCSSRTTRSQMRNARSGARAGSSSSPAARLHSRRCDPARIARVGTSAWWS